MEYFRALWYARIMPILYLVSMWFLLSCALSIFAGDILTGFGTASALALFQVTKEHFYIDTQWLEEVRKHVESYEEERE